MEATRLQAVLIGLLTVAVYLALPERVYFFDGVSFAGGVEYALENPGHSDILYRFPKHYLYIPTVYGLARLTTVVVPATAVDAYRLMQILAGCLAGVLNGVLFFFLRRRIVSVWVCLGLVAVWAFSNIHWERALEGQSYFAGQFWAILALITFAAAAQGATGNGGNVGQFGGTSSLDTADWPGGARNPDVEILPGTVWAMAIFTTLGGLFHVSNVIVVLPIVATWLWSSGSRVLRPAAGYVFKAGLLTATLPFLHYRLWDLSQFRQWFQTSVNDTEFYSWGFFVVPTLDSLVQKSLLLFGEFLVPLYGIGTWMLAGLALTGLFLATAGAGLRATSVLFRLGLLTFVTWSVFFSVATPGYLFHWELAFFGLWLLLVTGFSGRPTLRWQGRALAVSLAILAVAVPSFNLTQKYWPISRDDYNRDAVAATRLGGMIPPSEPLFLLGGGAPDNNLKAYMIHFGDRGWLAADITMMGVPPESRCTAFAQEMRRRLDQRGVVFLSTTLLDEDALEVAAERYGCPDVKIMVPLQEMTCAVLDGSPDVGLILASSGNSGAVAALEEYYRTENRPDLASALEGPQVLGSCRPDTALATGAIRP